MCTAVMKGLRFAYTEESRIQALKRSNMSSADLEGGCSSDIHEFCFQAAKHSHIDCLELQGGLFADCQKWHFQAAKRSDKSRTILQEG